MAKQIKRSIRNALGQSKCGRAGRATPREPGGLGSRIARRFRSCGLGTTLPPMPRQPALPVEFHR